MALGAIYALILYYKEHSFKDPSPNLKRIIIVLGVTRFVLVTIIAILLLSPLVKARFTQIEKPIVAIVQDNSSSLANFFGSEDSVSYVQKINALADELQGDFEVRKFGFGNELVSNEDFSFEEGATNMSNALEKVGEIFDGRNLGAVIIASDGIYNQGVNPIYSHNQLIVPIYTIGLGDTSVQKDLILTKVNFNHIAYLGDKFPLEIEVAANHCMDDNTSITIVKIEAGKRTRKFNKSVSINSDNFYFSLPVILDADEPGIQHYRIELPALEGEVTPHNNSQDIFVEVIDGRQKVLILANSPHPDLSALKQSIESNDNYEADVHFAANFNVNKIREYNLAILHQIPSRKNNKHTIFDILKGEKVPVLFIIGTQSYFPFLNNVQTILQISTTRKSNEVLAVINKDFSFFDLSESVKSQITDFPPLTAPFGEYKVAPNSTILLQQKIGVVETNFPLLAFNQSSNAREGILCGEGIWKWRLYDYKIHQNHQISDEFINKVIQYMSVKMDKRQFRVMILKNDLNENVSVKFDSELYNDAYELTNDPDVELKITNSEGEEFPYLFNRTEKAYTLDAGHFPVGNYSYSARVKYSNKIFTSKGEFSVSALRLESLSTTADHQLLYMLSENSEGSLYFPGNLSQLGEELKGRDDLTPIMNYTFENNPFINFKWLCLLLLALLTFEWATRKHQGAY